MKSRFEYIMNLLDLDSRTLANIAHVDKSLISKWKNGSRKLTLGAEYTLLLAEYIFESDKSKTKILDDVLTKYKTGYNELPDTEKVQFIALWLTDTGNEQLLDYSKSACKEYHVDFGAVNLKVEIDTLLREIDTIGYGKLYIMISNHLNIFLQDLEFLTEFVQDLEHLLDQGIEVEMYINESTLSNMTLDYVVLLIKLILKENFNLYFILNHLLNEHMMFIIHENKMLRSIVLGEDHFYEVINNRHTRYYYMKYLDSYYTNRQKANNYFIPKQSWELFNTVVNSGKRQDNSFFISSQLFITTIPEVLLEEILIDNGCGSAKTKLLIDFCNSIKANYDNNIKRFDNIHVYFESQLELLTVQDRFLSVHISSILNEEIWITKNQYKKHIFSMIDRLSNEENFHVFILNDQRITNLFKQLSIWIKDSETAIVWTNSNEPRAISIVNHDLLEAIINQIGRLIQSHMNIENEKEKTVKQFERLIKLL